MPRRLTRLAAVSGRFIAPEGRPAGFSGRLARLVIGGLVVLAAAGSQDRVHADAAADGPDRYQLVSAQVVTDSARPPALKLSASGPIAFHVLTAAESDAPTSPNQLVARLYGITPGDLRAATNLAPFGLSVQAIDRDSLVTITVAGLPANAILVLRNGMRANELQAAIVAAP
jgi:hypothetical protein